MKRLVIIILFFGTLNSYGQQGIILGNDSLVQVTFQNNTQEQVVDMAEAISQKYNRVVLHLGRKYPFGRGGFFQSSQSQENLKAFCMALNRREVEVHLWYMDSYGKDGFKALYEDHEGITNNLVEELMRLEVPYQGLVLDMEWINRSGGNNNKKYLEILAYVKKKAKGKQVHAFASIIDVPDHNKKRGYDEAKISKVIDGIWPMLYPADGGFHKKMGNIQPWVRDIRIDSMRTYFDSRSYQVVISAEPVLLKKRLFGVTHLASPTQSASLFSHLKKKRVKKYKYYTITKYKAVSDFSVANRKGEKKQVKSKQKLFYFQIKPELVQANDLIWEYTYLH
ncbi:hypothetical protein KFE98_06920 [bacterium SCSIO 12741]|nr:hypothetical protein KFE98_06920 [bacterium SCSIO 12741]